MDNLSVKNDSETKENKKNLFSTNTIAKIAILSAVATVLMLLKTPIFLIPGFIS